MESAPLHYSYEEALAVLKRALAFGINPSLKGIELLMHALGDPQNSFAPIQVTGTNGKTSTTRLIDALLRASHQSSGYYTSPELIDYTERIVVNGTPITREEFARLLEQVNAARMRLSREGIYAGNQITEFELLTALALLAFKEHALDFAVLEVGLGGRWDATSVVAPSVAVVTGVGLDHTKILGDTVEAIAADKAMIIKPGSTPVLGLGLGNALPVVLERCKGVGAHPRIVCKLGEATPLLEELTTRIEILEIAQSAEKLVETRFNVRTPHALYENLTISEPEYQAYSVATALTAAEAALGRALKQGEVLHALAEVRFPARFEMLRKDPLLIFDGGHNPQAARHLAQNLERAGVRPIAALGVFADKDYRSIIEILAPAVSGFIAIDNGQQRSLPAPQLAQEIERITGESCLAVLEQPELKDIEAVTKSQPTLITGSLSLYVLLKSYSEHTQ